MRPFWTFLHRWVGLGTAVFLFLTGVTGAVISWDHELDAWLNPHLTAAQPNPEGLPGISTLELARQIEQRHPTVTVRFIPLHVEPGRSVAFGVAPRVNPATQKLHEPGFNQVFVDPVSGQELGQRQWGAVWPISRETFVSFLYKFHHTLHLPEMWGIDRWGTWLLGGVAILWTLDCFVGAYLTLPVRRKAKPQPGDGLAGDAVGALKTGKGWWQLWAPAWKIRSRAGAYKLNFDMHRAVSLWTWGLLFIVAFTAFSLNLNREIFRPLLTTFSQVSPNPFTQRKPAPKHQPILPVLDYAQALAQATADAQAKGWPEPPGSVFYSQSLGIYGIDFFQSDTTPGSINKRLYYDGKDGRFVGERLLWAGSVADIFLQAQFPLHSGRILGLPGRILISLLGVVVAMLSVTGVYIWWKKRRARQVVATRVAVPAANLCIK
nr:PepSY-associated TM helix domain-containing protein [uncultured Rhodoferax sp.]